MRLFPTTIKALGVTHRIGGHVYILEERITKIARWPEPGSQSEVRGFLGTMGITRRWVKNSAEIARPPTRLTGKVEWRWTQAEQLSFEILKIKCATRTSMYGLDLEYVVHIYTDASGFAAGCAVTQFQPFTIADVVLQEASQAGATTPRKAFTASKTSSKRATAQAVEVSILYDSFTFCPT